MALSLSANHLVKRYGGVTALKDANLEIRAGEILALVGANGSGKSTLGKIITGVAVPDAGQLLLDGNEVRFPSPQAAQRRGIAAVYQELSLVPNMTVEENIWLGHEPLNPIGGVRANETWRRTERLIDLFAGTVQLALRPDSPVANLPPDEKQIIEILKAYSREPRLLILDEATASLDNRQVNRLFELVGEWRKNGMALIFISHRMYEIFRLAERVTVLRSGETVAHAAIKDVSQQDLVNFMIVGGILLQEEGKKAPPPREQAILELNQVRSERLRGVSLMAYRGEILGLGGLRGQGQSSLLRTVFGAIPFTGEIILDEKPIRFTHPRQAIRAGIAFVPGERSTEGLLTIRSILENLQIPSWRRYGLPLDIHQAQKDALKVTDQLNLVMSGLDASVDTLSGGNAQKVVLGKWLLRSPRLLLLDDPTKGIDVGAKNEFYGLLNQLQDQGVTIIFYSSDDDELLHLCNRILVLHDGLISAELTGKDMTLANLVSASLGSQEEGV